MSVLHSYVVLILRIGFVRTPRDLIGIAFACVKFV